MIKNDPDFVISPGLIDLPNADALASTSARDPPKQESCTGFQKYVTKGTRTKQYMALYALYNTMLAVTR